MKRKSELITSMHNLLTGLDPVLGQELQANGLRDFRLVTRQPQDKLLPVVMDLDLGNGRTAKRLRLVLSPMSIVIQQLDLPFATRKPPTSIRSVAIVPYRYNGTK